MADPYLVRAVNFKRRWRSFLVMRMEEEVEEEELAAFLIADYLDSTVWTDRSFQPSVSTAFGHGSAMRCHRFRRAVDWVKPLRRFSGWPTAAGQWDRNFYRIVSAGNPLQNGEITVKLTSLTNSMKLTG